MGVQRKLVGGFTAAVLAGICLTAATASALVPLGDYDGDGLSDVASVSINRDTGRTVWSIRSSASGSTSSVTFLAAGDALVPGRYFGGVKTYPGIASVRSSDSQIEWRIRSPFGTDNVYYFGVNGDTIPNQGDLDCDGIADLAFVRDGTATFWPGFRLWYVLLSSDPGHPQQGVFGLAGDKLFTADVDGDGCAEMVALRPGFYTWYAKKFFATDLTAVQWGLPGDVPLLPQDIDGDGLQDYIVARPTAGGEQIGYVRFAAGGYTTLTLGSFSTIPMVGYFTGQGGRFAWLDRSDKILSIRGADGAVSTSTFGSSAAAVVRPDGTAVQPDETGRFGSGASNLTCDATIRRNDGSGGFKNNPVNSRHTIKIMFPGSMTGNIDSVNLYADGALFDTMRLGGYEWGNRERWYGRKPIALYPDNLLVVAGMRDGENRCVELPDPQQFYD